MAEGRGVEFLDEPGRARHVLAVVVHHHLGGEGEAVGAAVLDGGLEAGLHLAERHGRSLLGQDGLDECDRVLGGEELQREDARLAAALRI
ncbi:MAG: hypothetical protein EBZ53_01325, partial [Verrucomicrobia bacterium]|nr:hypothetical protein [Verrucomicrobiota bacterium]